MGFKFGDPNNFSGDTLNGMINSVMSSKNLFLGSPEGHASYFQSAPQASIAPAPAAPTYGLT